MSKPEREVYGHFKLEWMDRDCVACGGWAWDAEARRTEAAADGRLDCPDCAGKGFAALPPQELDND